MFEAALNVCGRADRRVDRVRQPARRARATAARGPRRRASTPPTTPERWLAVSVATDEQWPALADVLGRPDWATDPALRDARRPRAPPRPPRRRARRVGGARPTSTRRSTCSSRPGSRPRRRSTPGARRSTRSSSPAASTSTVDHPVDRRARPIPSVPFRFAGVDRWIRHRGADPRSAQPRDPHRRSASTDDELAALEADGVDRHPTRRTLRSRPCPPPARQPTCSTARVIDVDTHLTEPPDVWTARVPAALHEQVPHIERVDGSDVWMADGNDSARPATTRWPASTASCRSRSRRPTTRSRRRCTTPTARLRFLDEQGIEAQVLYPNVGGFGNGYFLRLGDRELVAHVRAGLQRLPHRLVQRRSRPAARDHRAAVLGRRPRRSPSCSAASSTATGRSTSATSRRTTASRRSRTRTGTRSGPRPRRPASRSASTSAAARWARSSTTTPRWGG